MKFKDIRILIVAISLIIFASCEKEDGPTKDCINEAFFSEYGSRNFEMGFSTWAYAPTLESVDASYEFIGQNSDVYSEHIDSNIPWNAWMNDSPLPEEFTAEIANRATRKLPNAKLTVSVSFLNISRDDIAPDFDGTIPNYNALNDQEIEDAYFKHLQYITNQLQPDYLLVGIEGNELLINSPEKWEAYKSLMTTVRARIGQEYPALELSESITLHNLYKPEVTDEAAYIDEVVNYANTMDFVSISFYPYFQGLNSSEGFQQAFDFLHEQFDKPIAFAETSHLSEDLTVESYDLFIAGNHCEQNAYLESLLTNAQQQDYIYIIWWAHRDYNELWNTFPEDVKDLGKLWISTGIVNEDGAMKKAYSTWEMALNK